jgi:hypothetical protein
MRLLNHSVFLLICDRKEYFPPAGQLLLSESRRIDRNRDDPFTCFHLLVSYWLGAPESK